jgi:cystathionine gamma-lyase
MKSEERSSKILAFATRAVHAGQEPAGPINAVMTPIYQNSTYVQSSPGEYHDGYDYSRTKNPTRTALERNLASLEGAAHGMCFSSGCAAADAVLHLLSTGDHVICGDDVYGGTFRLFDKVFQRLGISFSYVNLEDAGALEAALRPESKMLWLESPTNPLLKISDIETLSAAAKSRGLITVVDNTFCSPYLQNPLSLGADIVVHSSTKYIGGHSDVIGGAVVVNNDELAERLSYLQNAIGAVPAPMDCFLLLRSTKTLALRMERHTENAQRIAEFLESREDVEKVIYPGLASHPQYELAKRQMRLPGGMISLVLKGGMPRARSFLENVQLFSLAESLGGVESLIEHPAIMTHATIPPETRAKLGISDGLVRLSVGVEDQNDLLNDLRSALDKG